MKIALTSTVIPPGPTGQARVLGHLLAGRNVDDVLLLTDQADGGLDEDAPPLGRVEVLQPPRFSMSSLTNRSFLRPWDNRLALAVTIRKRAGEIAIAAKSHRSEVLIGCSGNPFDLSSTYLAARRLRLPFIAYLFDDPVLQWPEGIYRSLAASWEPKWARGAARIIVPNEVLAEDIAERQPDARTALVRNPVPDDAFTVLAAHKRPDRAPARIVYTGTIYSAQADAVHNLVAALDKGNGAHELHIYTHQAPEQLKELGIAGPHVHVHSHLTQQQSYAAQREADILLLPLAFAKDVRQVIRSSAPGKLAEYLASGTPVLAHAPEGSFVARFFQKHECGVLADQPDVDALTQALGRLGDAALRKQLVANALDAAQRFTLGRVRRSFDEALDAARRGERDE